MPVFWYPGSDLAYRLVLGDMCDVFFKSGEFLSAHTKQAGLSLLAWKELNSFR